MGYLENACTGDKQSVLDLKIDGRLEGVAIDSIEYIGRVSDGVVVAGR